MTREQATRLWQAQRAAQIDWADAQTRAGVYPDGPYTYLAPEMTVPPPYSPEWYRRYRP